MKIVNRTDFLGMPSGTIFCKYEPSGNFGQLEVKCCDPEQWTPDYVSMELHGGWLQGPQNSDELFNKYDRIESGEEFRFALDTSSRDGLFEDDQLFAVYDTTDIQNLIKALQECLPKQL